MSGKIQPRVIGPSCLLAGFSRLQLNIVTMANLVAWRLEPASAARSSRSATRFGQPLLPAHQLQLDSVVGVIRECVGGGEGTFFFS